MTQHTRLFLHEGRSYEVSMDDDMDGGEPKVTGCWINYTDRATRTTYASSLQAALDQGGLSDADYITIHPLPESLLDAIEAWAQAHGY